MLGVLMRFIVAALVILFLGFLLPGFHISGFWTALMAAAIIALLGWAVELLFGKRVSPYGRGLVGFLVGSVVIYSVQFVVAGVNVSLMGALLASLAIGIIDAFVPSELH